MASQRFFWRRVIPLCLLVGSIGLIRWNNGAGLADAYAFLVRPFWPGPAQREWIQSGFLIEQQTRLELLQEDNDRLRKILSLKGSSKAGVISAAVISRRTNGWWQQIQLGQGSMAGIDVGDAVIGPGGLLGIIETVTPMTARVRLLTASSSQVGVWVARIKRHGMLIGMGTNKPQLRFLDKDSQLLPGDVVSTSPASTLVPPNLPVGVIQSLDKKALLAPVAIVQLTAAPEAIDWVQVQKI